MEAKFVPCNYTVQSFIQLHRIKICIYSYLLTYSLRNLLQVRRFEYMLTNTTALFISVFLSIQPRKEQIVSCVLLRAPTQAEKSNSLPNEVGPTHNA